MNRFDRPCAGLAVMLIGLVAVGRASAIEPWVYASADAATAGCLAESLGRDECLAEVAVDWGTSDPCERSSDRRACLDRVGARAVEGCEAVAAADRELCFTLAASELGVVEACDRVRPGDRRTCYGSAAVVRRDPSIISERVPAGEERDLLLGAYATGTLDSEALDLVGDANTRELMRMALILPLAMERGIQPSDSACAGLPTDLGGEYGEGDAQVNREVCQRAADLARQWGGLETDAERDRFRQALADESQRIADEIAADAAAHDKYALYDQMGLERPDGGREEPLPEGTLAFYTGQKNVVHVDVWNGTRRPLRRVGVQIDGEQSWLSIESIRPAALDVPPGETREITLTFSVLPEAPEGARQQVTIAAAAEEDGDEPDPILVDRFDIVVRRRAMTVRVEAPRDGARGAPQ